MHESVYLAIHETGDHFHYYGNIEAFRKLSEAVSFARKLAIIYGHPSFSPEVVDNIGQGQPRLLFKITYNRENAHIAVVRKELSRNV